MRRDELSDEHWEEGKDLLPPNGGRGGSAARMPSFRAGESGASSSRATWPNAPGPEVGLKNHHDVTLQNSGEWAQLRWLSENHGRLSLRAESAPQSLVVSDPPLLNTGTILVSGDPSAPNLGAYLGLREGLTIAEGGSVELQGYATLEVGSASASGWHEKNLIEVVGGTPRAGPVATIAGLSGTTLEGGNSCGPSATPWTRRPGS